MKSALAIALVTMALACSGQVSPPLEVKKGAAQMVSYDGKDRVVRLTGPSSIVVYQSGKLRLMINWSQSQAHDFQVPLGAVNDGSGSQFEVGVCPSMDCPPCGVAEPDPGAWRCWDKGSTGCCEQD